MITTIDELKNFLQGRKLSKEDIPNLAEEALYKIAEQMANKLLPIHWNDLPDINSLWDYIDENGGMTFEELKDAVKEACSDRLSETGFDMEMFENMTRKHNWDQLQVIQSKIEKQGGDISKQLGKHYKRQSKTANSYWIDNPLKKKIDLSDDEPNANTHTDSHMKDLPKNSLIKFEDFKVNESEEKENKNKKEDSIRKEDRGNYNKIAREMKTVRTWNNYFTDNVGGNPDPKKERNVLAGRQVMYGDNKEGYIEDVKGDKVIVQTLDNTGHDIVKFSEITKNYKIEKQDKIEDVSLQGPKQESETKQPDESKEQLKKLEDKADVDKQTAKIAKEIYKGKDLKLKNLQKFGNTKF